MWCNVSCRGDFPLELACNNGRYIFNWTLRLIYNDMTFSCFGLSNLCWIILVDHIQEIRDQAQQPGPTFIRSLMSSETLHSSLLFHCLRPFSHYLRKGDYGPISIRKCCIISVWIPIIKIRDYSGGLWCHGNRSPGCIRQLSAWPASL